MDKRTLSMEIIPLDGFRTFISFMPNPIEIFGTYRDAMTTYREMKREGRIKSLLRARKNIVIGLPYRITQAKSRDMVFKFVQDNLWKYLSWDREIRGFLSALEYRFSVLEVVWRDENGSWIPKALVPRRQERFRFETNGDLVLSAEGKNLSSIPYKFLVHKNDPEAEDPYGTSDLDACFWPWTFKKAGFEFWLSATEKFGVPSLIALFDTQDSRVAKDRAKEIAEALIDISSGSAASLANVKEVKALEMSGNVADFKVLIDTCNAEISYALTGQTLATGEAQYDTRAASEVHSGTFHDQGKGDAKALGPTLQTLIDWMVELNFGPEEPSPWGEFDLSDYASFEEVMSAIERGVPVSRSQLYDRYGLPKPKDEGDAFVKPEGLQPPLSLSDKPKKKLKLL